MRHLFFRHTSLAFLWPGLLVFMALSFGSCDDSFLEVESPNLLETGDTLFVWNQAEPFNVTFDFNSPGAGKWRLYQYPKWLEISPKEGSVRKNAAEILYFSINRDQIYLDYGLYTFPLSFYVEGAGLVNYTVAFFNLGNPTIEVWPSNLEIEGASTGYFSIQNGGNGILLWEITHSPTWLNFVKKQGTINQWYSEDVSYTVDAAGLEQGDYQGVVEIASNATEESYKLPVSLKIIDQVPVVSFGVYHQGEFIDSEFVRRNNQVVVLTQNPNRLLFFGPGESESSYLDLDRVPKCMALSEDEAWIAVGYSNTEISIYNVNDKSRLSTYQVGAIPLSVEFGNANWFYYLAESKFENAIYSLNLESGVSYLSEMERSGWKKLQKVPGKNVLVSTQPGYSPDGLFVFDITENPLNEAFNRYFLSMQGFWVSDDGNRLLTGSRKIYQLPGYVPGVDYFSDPPPLEGELSVDYDWAVECIAQDTISGNIYAATGFGWSRQKTRVEVFNRQTFVKQSSYALSFNPPEDFPEGNTWWGKPVALYPGIDRNTLWLVHKFAAKSYNEPELWTVARVEL